MSEILNDLIRLKVEAAGASPEASDILATLIRSKLDVREDGTVRVLNPQGGVRIGGGPNYGDMTLDEFVAEVAASKPSIFARTAATETPAAPPASRATPAFEPGANPYRRDTMNRTHQTIIEKRDPATAARLRAEAAAMPVIIMNTPRR